MDDCMKMKNLGVILISVLVLLLIPFVAMQFTSEVNWNILDFIIMGILLFGTGLFCELILRKVKSTQYRILICGLLLLIFFLVWAELAVGIFGTPLAGN
jgi:hypothetical protein